jgi:hypothetical protein
MEDVLAMIEGELPGIRRGLAKERAALERLEDPTERKYLTAMVACTELTLEMAEAKRRVLRTVLTDSPTASITN